jgi:hypothetical protein
MYFGNAIIKLSATCEKISETSNLIRSNTVSKCLIFINLKYFPTTFDPGAISLPGVLNGYKKILKLIFNGQHFRFILIRRNKAGHWKNCLPAEILILVR